MSLSPRPPVAPWSKTDDLAAAQGIPQNSFSSEIADRPTAWLKPTTVARVV